MLRRILCLTLLSAPLALAQEEPAKRPVVLQLDVNAQAGDAHELAANGPVLLLRAPLGMEKSTSLGVGTSPVPGATAEQLKLARGVGLVVDRVDPKSAADIAGIKPHDIIEKLDDQLIVNTEQLTRLIQSHKVGDEVTLTIVRKGERQQIKAKLALGAPLEDQMGVFNIAIPPNAADHIMQLPGGPGARRVMIKNINGQQNTVWADPTHKITIEKQNDKITHVTIDDQAGKTLSSVDGDADAVRKALAKTPELLEKFNQAEQAAQVQPVRIAFDPANAVNFAMTGAQARGKVFTWSDEQYILMLRMMGKQPTYLLALSKKDGRVLFDGPVMSDEQRKSVPGQVAEQFELVVSQPQLLKEFGVVEKK